MYYTNITSIFLSLESEREKDLCGTDAKIEQRNQFFLYSKITLNFSKSSLFHYVVGSTV